MTTTTDVSAITKEALTLAAQRRQAAPVKKYKGKYIGPDKYKGVAQQDKKKFKGKYAGPDKYKGKVPASYYDKVSSNAVKSVTNRLKNSKKSGNSSTPTYTTPANPEPGKVYAQYNV